jgi:hypothetical protein
MKSLVNIVTLFFVCAIFFFLGFLSYSRFYHIVLPDVVGIQYKMDLAAIGSNQDLFGVIAAAIPLLLFFTWQLIPLYNNDKKTFSVLLVIICIVLAVYIRYKILVSEFTKMVESSSSKTSLIAIPFEQLGFEWYVAGGLLVGCIISFMAFHNKIVRRRFPVHGN